MTARSVKSEAQHRLMCRRIAARPTTFRYVSCWPANEAVGRVLGRRAGSNGVGSSVAERGERVGDRRGEIVRDRDRFDGPTDLRVDRADRVPVIRTQERKLIEPIVDRRCFRRDPPEGIRRHAEAHRHADAFDPRQRPQLRALATDDPDLQLVDLSETQHVGLDHCATSGPAGRRQRDIESTFGGLLQVPHPRLR